MSWVRSNASATMGSRSRSAWRRAAQTTMSASSISTTATRLRSARTQMGHMTASVGRDSLVMASAVRSGIPLSFFLCFLHDENLLCRTSMNVSRTTEVATKMLNA